MISKALDDDKALKDAHKKKRQDYAVALKDEIGAKKEL